MKVRKEIIKPGEYRKGDEVIAVTPERIDRWIENHAALTTQGYKVPWWLEGHKPVGSDEAFPANAEQADRFQKDQRFAGWQDGFEKGEDGTLYAIVDMPEDKAELFTKNGGLVSPQFGPFSGAGIDDCVSHVALTTWPVNKEQNNQFSVMGTQTRFDAFTANPKFEVVQFDDAGAGDPTTDDAKKARFAKLRSALAAIGLAISEEAGASLDTLIGELASAAGSAKLTRDQMKTQQPGGEITEHSSQIAMSGIAAEVIQFAEAGGKSVRDCVADALKALGLKIADDSPIPADASSLAEMLASLAHSIRFKADRATREGIYAMSDVKTAPAVDPEVAAKLTQMSAVNSKLVERVTAQERKAYKDRIETAVKTGRCTPARADKLNALADTHQFSETESGNVALDTQLEVLEDLPEGAVWSDSEKVKQFGIEEERKGSFFTPDGEGEMTEEEMDRLAKELG